MIRLLYSYFILDSETTQNERDIISERNKQRQQLIKNYVKSNGYIELNHIYYGLNRYYGLDSYYYDKQKKTMYKVCNVCDWSGNINPVFEISYDENVLKLNSLI